jgi:acyl-coenzyme A synthetase/AMP-(fatty) acid ligase
VSSVELERVLLEELNHSLLEVAAVGVPSPGGGPELLHLFVVRHPSATPSSSSSNSTSSSTSLPVPPATADGGGGGKPFTEAELKAACQAVIRTKLNPLFRVDKVVVAEALPRTASNKVMRRVLRNVAMQQQQQQQGKGQVKAKL